jgi:dTMP kinase
MGLLKGFLEGRGERVVALREPGGTPLGEVVRSILLNRAVENPVDINPWAELFLYEACRAQLTEEVIRPALEGGLTVLCDRFIDSTVAYQGYGRGLDAGAIALINTSATGAVTPDLTILLDVDPAEGLKRAWERIEKTRGAREDRFESEELEFHRRVRVGYLKIAEAEPKRVKVVDGSGQIPSIHKEICDIIEKLGP